MTDPFVGMIERWKQFKAEAEALPENDVEALFELQNRIGAATGIFECHRKPELIEWCDNTIKRYTQMLEAVLES